MRRLSIRWRLTLWYAGVLATVLVGFGLAVYFIMRAHLLARIDHAVAEELEELEEEIERAEDRESLEERLRRRFTRHEGFEFQVATTGGEVLFVSEGLDDRRFPLSDWHPRSERSAPDPRSGAARVFRTASLEGLGRFRAQSTYTEGREGPLLSLAATSLEWYDHEMGELLAVLAVSGSVALVGSVAGGYLLARKALAPVDDMTAAAEEIRGERLDRRIEVANPDDELGRLARTLNAMFARLDRSFEEMRRFTADAAHELRTPLAVLRTEVEVALRTPRTPEEYRGILESVLEETERLSRMADQLLALCREDAGLQTPLREEVDLSRIARDVAEHARAWARESNVDLDVGGCPSAVVLGDAARLRQLLFNLLDNAIKHTPAGGRIEVRSEASDNQVRMIVADSGVGIPPEHLPHVFERFYRVDKARSREMGGTGLGLAICKAIVEAHGGRIGVESQQGRGTRIVVELPRKEAS